jgi:hypothetical protein
MMTGYMYGTYKQATAHFKFQNALENPTGLEQAMENVNRRMGAQQPLNISLHFARRDNLKRPDQETPSAEPTDEWDQPSAEPSPSQPAPRKPGPGELRSSSCFEKWLTVIFQLQEPSMKLADAGRRSGRQTLAVRRTLPGTDYVRHTSELEF